MMNRLVLGLLAGLTVVSSTAIAQNAGTHAKHHTKVAKTRVAKKSPMAMCCCMQGQMGGMGMGGMQPRGRMRGMAPMRPGGMGGPGGGFGQPPMPGHGGGGFGQPGMPGQDGQPPMMGATPMAPMPPMDPQMMADMNAQDQKIQELLKAMNDAPQEGKLDAAIAVINALADQRASLKKMMMGHMMQMRGMNPGRTGAPAHEPPTRK